MNVSQVSKCIFIVNDVRIDIRKRGLNPVKFTGCRQALNLYYQSRENKLNVYQIDEKVCKLMNKGLINNI